MIETDAREEFGAPYYQIHRADFHAYLVWCIEAIALDCVVLNYQLEGVTQTDGAVQLIFSNGERGMLEAGGFKIEAGRQT